MITLLMGITTISANEVNQSDNELIEQADTHSADAVITNTENNSSVKKDSDTENNSNSDNTTTNTNESTDTTESISTESTSDDKQVKEASKKQAEMTISNKTILYGEEALLTVTVVDKDTREYVDGGQVAFKVNGVTVGYATLSNGKAYYTYNSSTNSAKTYTLSATYGGNSEYDSTKSKSNSSLVIEKHNVSMTVSNKTVYKNNEVQLVITVVDKNTGKYVTGGNVAFKINGKTIGYSNVTNGKAYYTYNTSGLSVRTYSLSGSYSGSDAVESTKVNGSTLKVESRPVSISVSNKTIKKGQKVQLVVTVVDKLTGNYANKGTVVFKVNGVTVGKATLSHGKAYFTYDSSTLQAKNYTLSATYTGSNTYSSIRSTNSTLKVTQNYTFTYAQIKEAAVYLRNHYEANDIITEVPIGSTTIGVEDFLPIMIKMAKLVNSGKSSESVEYIDYEPIDSQVDTISTQTLTTSDLLKIGNRVLEFYEENNRPSRYSTYGDEKIGYYNLVYCYTKLIDVSTSEYLPETCKVYSWSSIHPTDSTSRVIYITSDNIYNTQRDTAFMNEIKEVLESKGYTVYIMNIGPNAHNELIWDGSLPDNAVQLSIFGGADAGVIYDVCTRSYMRAKANRLVFFVYYPTATDITGLEWLGRAHDDNYSSSDFTGIAYPDEYLYEHGYDYIYSSSATAIANALIEYIS